MSYGEGFAFFHWHTLTWPHDAPCDGRSWVCREAWDNLQLFGEY